MPEQKLDLLQFASGQMAQGAPLRRRSWGARFAIPARRAAPFTTCQMALGVMCSPQIAPVLLTARKIKLVVIPAARVQLSTVHFTQFGIGTVRTCFPFPIKSATTQCSSRILKVVDLQPHQLGAPEAASDQNCQNSP